MGCSGVTPCLFLDDRTRLKMQVSPGYPPTDDYINACQVKLLTAGAPEFVCAQGPKHSTGGDFWKMMVQQRSRVIVMVTNLIENGRVKCDQVTGLMGRKRGAAGQREGMLCALTMAVCSIGPSLRGVPSSLPPLL